MAKTSNRFSTFLNMALVLTLVVILTMAESRAIFGVSVKSAPTITCDGVVGVNDGDTCFAIAKANNLTVQSFEAINPNLNCTALFVGQWVCIDGFLF